MSGDLPTCQQTKGERQRVPQFSDSRTLKPQPATPNPYGDHGFSARFRTPYPYGDHGFSARFRTPNPYGDHGFSARFRQTSRVWGGIVRPVFNEINGLTALQNYAIQSRICARARAHTHTYIPILCNV